MGVSLSKLIEYNEWMSDVIYSNSMFSTSWHNGSLTNFMLMDVLNVTDSSLHKSIIYQASLPYLVCSDHFLSCSLWRRLCSLTPDAIYLSHLVDSSALSYTVRSPRSFSAVLSHRTLKSFSMCASLKCMCTFVSIRSIKMFGIWPHVRRQTDIHTCLAMQSR